jgi:hypothetical protein
MSSRLPSCVSNSQGHFSLEEKIVRNFYILWLKSMAVTVTRNITENQEEVFRSEVDENFSLLQSSKTKTDKTPKGLGRGYFFMWHAFQRLFISIPVIIGLRNRSRLNKILLQSLLKWKWSITFLGNIWGNLGELS